jgi:hypothetical protein
MATFDECIDLSLTNSGLCLPEGIKLKEKQVQTLKSVFAKTDCMSILPTGYGESASAAIFVFSLKMPIDLKEIVLLHQFLIKY